MSNAVPMQRTLVKGQRKLFSAFGGA